MTGRTHIILGACAAVPVAVAVGGHLALPLCAAVGALGGLLPDIDHPGSALGRCVPWPHIAVGNEHGGFVLYGRRWFGGRVLWHRHETHSVGAAFIAALAMFGTVWWPWLTILRWATARGDLPPFRGPLWLAAADLPSALALAVLAGYLSHLVADLMNVSPQMLWWPFSRHMVRIPRWHGVPERSAEERWAEAAAMLVALTGTVLLWGPRPL